MKACGLFYTETAATCRINYCVHYSCVPYTPSHFMNDMVATKTVTLSNCLCPGTDSTSVEKMAVVINVGKNCVAVVVNHLQ